MEIYKRNGKLGNNYTQPSIKGLSEPIQMINDD